MGWGRNGVFEAEIIVRPVTAQAVSCTRRTTNRPIVTQTKPTNTPAII